MDPDEFEDKPVKCPFCEGQHNLRKNKSGNPLLHCTRFDIFYNFNTNRQQGWVRDNLVESAPLKVPLEVPQETPISSEIDPFEWGET